MVPMVDKNSTIMVRTGQMHTKEWFFPPNLENLEKTRLSTQCRMDTKNTQFNDDDHYKSSSQHTVCNGQNCGAVMRVKNYILW